MMQSAPRGAAGDPLALLPSRLPVICDRCKEEGDAGHAAFAGIADLLAFDPVPRRARADGWAAEYQRAFIYALALTGSPARAARAIGRHAFGAEQLRKARGARGFSEAWQAAIETYRDRELARLRENMSDLARAQDRQQWPHPVGEGGGEEEDAEHRAMLEAKARIRDRLLRARRLYLHTCCGDAEKQAAWEVLCGPVDWEKAKKLEPQDNEPFGTVSMRGPDMLLSAEAGTMADVTGGPSILTAFIEGIRQLRIDMGLDPDRAITPEEWEAARRNHGSRRDGAVDP